MLRCVCSIHNNIHLISGAIHYNNINNLPFSIVFLDQSKAFDRVDLSVSILAFDFECRSFIDLPYRELNIESLLKINGSLVATFDFKRGLGRIAL